jgi:hypothetical protein
MFLVPHLSYVCMYIHTLQSGSAEFATWAYVAHTRMHAFPVFETFATYLKHRNLALYCIVDGIHVCFKIEILLFASPSIRLSVPNGRACST